MGKKILLATDGSEYSKRAGDEAINLAINENAELTVITVVEENNYPIYEDDNIDNIESSIEEIKKVNKLREESAKNLLEKTIKSFKNKGVNAKSKLLKGHPAKAICSFASENDFDLVIMGCKGLGGIKEALMGSVCNRVASCVKTNTYIVK